MKRIEYERLIYYSKSPYSWDLPADWKRICETLPYLVKNKVRRAATVLTTDGDGGGGVGDGVAVEVKGKATKTGSLECSMLHTNSNVNALLANLRLHGPQLENVSKDTLDRALVIFRNASQDERLNIMTRLNLLQLIELRAKSWQVSDGANTYYKHKATNVEVSGWSCAQGQKVGFNGALCVCVFVLSA